MVALGEQVKLVTLHRRGASTCVTLSNAMRHRLGWNKGDTLRLDIVKGSLVVTKVTLAPPPDFANTGARTTVAGDVQSVSNNGSEVK